MEVEEDDEGEFAAQTIELDDDDGDGGAGRAEVEFNAVIQSVDGGRLSVETSFGPTTVILGPDTEVKVALEPGAEIKVHATRQSDGGYLAREIEAARPDGGDDHDEDDGDDSSGPGSDGSGASGSSDGSGSDDKTDNSGPGSTSSGSGDDGDDDDHPDGGADEEKEED